MAIEVMLIWMAMDTYGRMSEQERFEMGTDAEEVQASYRTFRGWSD